MKKAKIVNCHELSIRRDVDDPDIYEEITATLRAGDTILVDDSKIYWSWNDNPYYLTSDGYYARVECLEVIG